MIEHILIEWSYKAILAFLVVIFVHNLWEKKATVWDQILYAVILIPFVLRLFSIK